MAKYVVKTPIKGLTEDGKPVPVGETIDMTVKEARELVDAGALERVKPETKGND